MVNWCSILGVATNKSNTWPLSTKSHTTQTGILTLRTIKEVCSGRGKDPEASCKDRLGINHHTVYTKSYQFLFAIPFISKAHDHV